MPPIGMHFPYLDSGRLLVISAVCSPVSGVLLFLVAAESPFVLGAIRATLLVLLGLSVSPRVPALEDSLTSATQLPRHMA